MAINFTDSPADGATQVISGRTYTYNSAKNKWDTTATEVVGPTATVYATVDNLPGTATTGDQAFVTATNRLYIWNGTGWYNIALINTNPSISGADSSYALATDGTPTVVTITATDPEGLPITYSIASDTSGNIATVTSNNNVFTITPSTNTANAGTFSLTFRASDGVNIASAISSFTLQFKAVNSNYTTALITSVGTNNQVNNDFVDSSTNSHTITVYGNTTQTTFSPYRHGGYSTYFDGSGDYLSIADDATLRFGTGEFTVECWIYMNSLSRTVFIDKYDGTSAGWQLQYRDYNNVNHIAFSTNAGHYATTPSDEIETNTWYHVAVVRDSSNNVKIYIDGVEKGSSSSYTQDLNGTSALNIGVQTYNIAAGYMNGYISDARIVKGTAVYTSNFTPPTERLTAITNTSLLTCHLPYIADGSTNGHAITVNGNTKTEPFAPYDYETYSAADNLGSIYFDGSGDYLTVPSHASLSLDADFTLEYWVYISTSGVNNYFFTLGDSINASGLETYLGYSGSKFVIYSNNSIPLESTTIPTRNTWSHVALVRSGSTVTLYLNGTSLGTFSSTQTFSGNIHIGAEYFNGAISGSGAATLNGTLSDLRIIKGTALYTSSFTPPTAPLTAITNTSLLLSGTNAGIIDKSQSVKTLTLAGGTVSSTTQNKYLTSSIKFDGVDDQITIPQVSIASGEDFTIECWHYLTSRVDLYPALFGNYTSFTTGALSLFVGHNNSTTTAYQVAHNGTFPLINAGTINYNQWVHVALVRSGTTMTLYIDGTSVGTGTSSVALNGVGSNFFIGRIGDNASGHIEGYLSDFRITKGLARYTANFTPPTAALQG